MRKFYYYLIVISILALFILVMNSGDFLKHPLQPSDNVIQHLDTLAHQVENEEWINAGSSFKNLQTAWQKVSFRIQFSVEKDEINAIDVNLARLQSYIATQDFSEAMAVIAEIREHWNNLYY